MIEKDTHIQPRNEKDEAHGYWEWYFHNGDVCYKAYYINGVESDYKEYYYVAHIVELIFHL